MRDGGPGEVSLWRSSATGAHVGAGGSGAELVEIAAERFGDWTDEIRRRIDEVEAGTAELDDLDTVRARLEAASRLTRVRVATDRAKPRNPS